MPCASALGFRVPGQVFGFRGKAHAPWAVRHGGDFGQDIRIGFGFEYRRAAAGFVLLHLLFAGVLDPPVGDGGYGDEDVGLARLRHDGGVHLPGGLHRMDVYAARRGQGGRSA